jgi:hypothetical protein
VLYCQDSEITIQATEHTEITERMRELLVFLGGIRISMVFLGNLCALGG